MRDISENLKSMGERFSVDLEKHTGTWRILDKWHDSLQTVTDWDQDVPDDSPAVTILSDAAFQALVMEAARQGSLGRAALPTPMAEEYEDLLKDYNTQKETIKSLLEENKQLRQEGSRPVRSEKYDIKMKVIDSLVKLTVAEDIKSNEIK